MLTRQIAAPTVTTGGSSHRFTELCTTSFSLDPRSRSTSLTLLSVSSMLYFRVDLRTRCTYPPMPWLRIRAALGPGFT